MWRRTYSTDASRFAACLLLLSVLWSCGSMDGSSSADCELDAACSQQLLPCSAMDDVCGGPDVGWSTDAAQPARLQAIGYSADELWTRFGTVGSAARWARSPGGYAYCGLGDVRTDDLGHHSGLRLPEVSGVAAPVPDRSGRCGSDVETLSWRMANCERLTHGLQPLSCDLRLVRVSREHAGDMRRRDYFEHWSPEGYGPFDRLAAAGTTYLHAGENLARFPVSPDVVEAAHQAWMDSDPHRRNLLSEAYTHLGVGVVATPRSVLFGQLFLRP